MQRRGSLSGLSNADVYEICVVGAGLVGSSAAKYASKILSEKHPNQTGHRVCLIGPNEPKDKMRSDIYAAHYDEARICRRAAGDFRWATVTTRSIQRFRDIERESGVKFYEEVGCLMAADPNETNYVSLCHAAACKQNLDFAHLLNSTQLEKTFPYLRLNKNCTGLWESRGGGYINPRKLVQAQKILALKYGCDLYEDIVHSVSLAGSEKPGFGGSKSNNGELMRIETDSGRILFAKTVLLATNAFTEGFRNLLPSEIHLDMKIARQAVIYVEFSSSDLEKLKGMPSMLIKVPGTPLVDRTSAEAYDCYILPPVLYPDGKYYLKLGHGDQMHRYLTPEQLVRWYREPVPDDIIQTLKDIFYTLFPGLNPVHISTDTCATVDTITDLPFISFLPNDNGMTSSLAVAVGDCGCSAKCSDELGRLAAELVISGWSDPVLEERDYRVRIKRKMKASL